MRHITLSFLLLACCGGPFPTFGDGHIVSEERTGEAVTKVAVEDALHAEITVGDGPSLTIRTDQNLIDKIETVVEDGVLHVRVRRLQVIDPTQLDIQIHLPAVDSVDGSGASELKLHAQPATDLALEVSGAATLQVDGLAHTSVTARASGASVLHLQGTSSKLDIDASGASGVEGKDLTLADAKVDISGASHATLSATESVTGEVSGASTLTLSVKPKTQNVDVSGASTIN